MARRRLSDLSIIYPTIILPTQLVPSAAAAAALDVLTADGDGNFGWAAPGELPPPPPSGITRASSGAAFLDRFNRSDRDLDGDNGWSVEAGDLGTMEIQGNEAVITSSNNLSRIRNLTATQLNGFWEMRYKTPAGNAVYGGLRSRVFGTAWDDFHTFIRDNEWQFNYAVAGSSGTASSSTTDADANVYHSQRVQISNGATRTVQLWLNRSSLYGPASLGAGPTVAGGIGFISYGGAGLIIASIVMYTTTVITMNGLSGTMGFRIYDAADSLVGSSGAQSIGVATVDQPSAMDFPFNGKIKLFSDAPTYSDQIAVFPSSGNDPDIVGGDLYHYEAA